MTSKLGQTVADSTSNGAFGDGKAIGDLGTLLVQVDQRSIAFGTNDVKYEDITLDDAHRIGRGHGPSIVPLDERIACD